MIWDIFHYGREYDVAGNCYREENRQANTHLATYCCVFDLSKGLQWLKTTDMGLCIDVSCLQPITYTLHNRQNYKERNSPVLFYVFLKICLQRVHFIYINGFQIEWRLHGIFYHLNMMFQTDFIQLSKQWNLSDYFLILSYPQKW